MAILSIEYNIKERKITMSSGPISEYDGLGKCSLCGEAHSPLKPCSGTEDLFCMFCGDPVGGDFVTDDNEGIACRTCASAEVAAQRTEHRLERLRALGLGDAADFASDVGKAPR